LEQVPTFLKLGDIKVTMEEKCYVDTTLNSIGGKWKLIILWYIHKEKLRFSELEKKIPGINQKMLTQQLRELEKDELISRKVYPVVPPKVEYAITDHGKSLQKVLKELDKWGKIHHERKK
jgi:DNA-binding HxlR family transcriptional regulator